MSAAPWKGLSVLITSGPTREYLDPVRFLTNASSGSMGSALARAARGLGARVTMVSGPASVPPPPGVAVVPVTTAAQMHRQTLARARKADVIIAAAAVGDWRFSRPSARKIKRTPAPLSVRLLPNRDIVADVARARRGRRPLVVGFALETDRWLQRAWRKLEDKGLDLIVANQASALGGGRTRVAVLAAGEKPRVFPPSTKSRAARDILRCVARALERDARR